MITIWRCSPQLPYKSTNSLSVVFRRVDPIGQKNVTPSSHTFRVLSVASYEAETKTKMYIAHEQMKAATMVLKMLFYPYTIIFLSAVYYIDKLYNVMYTLIINISNITFG